MPHSFSFFVCFLPYSVCLYSTMSMFAFFGFFGVRDRYEWDKHWHTLIYGPIFHDEWHSLKSLSLALRIVGPHFSVLFVLSFRSIFVFHPNTFLLLLLQPHFLQHSLPVYLSVALILLFSWSFAVFVIYESWSSAIVMHVCTYTCCLYAVYKDCICM